MACLVYRETGFQVHFRVGGVQFKPSLGTLDETEARGRLADVEYLLRELKHGRRQLPSGASRQTIRDFILSGGRLTEQPTVRKSITLGAMIKTYFESYAVAKEASTVKHEKVHARHLERLLGTGTAMDSISLAMIQESYVPARLSETGKKDKPLSSGTIKKELVTLDQLWSAAVKGGYVSGASPTKGVSLPKARESEPFRTWSEVEAVVRRGDLSESAAADCWESLFLDETQVAEFLDDIRDTAPQFMFAALAFAAYTGARRSEVARSLREDWDFSAGVVRIREKKGDHRKSFTIRTVEIHPKLRTIMEKWFKVHPGGNHTIVGAGGRPMTECQTYHFFRDAVAGSKWTVLKGWHTLRHSFCSNCARRGFPESMIDAWMGHRGNEAIKRRYRHLFPSDRRDFMRLLWTVQEPAAVPDGSTVPSTSHAESAKNAAA